MKYIKLTQGKVALVDDSDYNWLNQHKWYAHKNQGNFYAVRRSIRTNEKGKHFTISMHRQILRLGYGDKREGDHQNHNTLDNRRDNLRVCTHRENIMNQTPQLNKTSKFKGVYWCKTRKKWGAYITIKKRMKNLGRFADEKQAALVYNTAAKKYFGKFAFLNVFT